MFLYLLLIVFLSLLLLTHAGICDSDKDCQDGSSCIENICKICVKCSLIFRKGKTCESDFNDCGDCLEGYIEISVTVNSAVKKPCQPMKKKRKLKECANDNDCSPNHYCSETTCVKCFDCSFLNRLEPETCVKDPDECGPCLIGYFSIRYGSRTNYKKCEKVLHDPVPFNIESGSVLLAVLLFCVVAVAFANFLIKNYRGPASSRTINHQLCPSYMEEGPQEESPRGGAPVKNCNDAESSSNQKFLNSPQPLIILKRMKAQFLKLTQDIMRRAVNLIHLTGEDTNSSHETITPGEHGGPSVGSLSVVDSVNSGTDSQDEQLVGRNVLNSDFAENSSHLVTEDPAQVPEASSKGT